MVAEPEPSSLIIKLSPSILAGAVGAFGTWLSTLYCYRRMLAIDTAVVTTLVGAMLGPLYLAGGFVLYIVWQSAVAACLARGIVNNR
jgi:hypothetical protein